MDHSYKELYRVYRCCSGSGEVIVWIRRVKGREYKVGVRVQVSGLGFRIGSFGVEGVESLGN